MDAALGAGAHRLHPWKALVAVLLQRLKDLATAKRAGVELGALAFGLQAGQVMKATQDHHLVQGANVGEPAAQQFALALGGKGFDIFSGLGRSAKRQGQGGEFVIHGRPFEKCVAQGLGCRVVGGDVAKGHGGPEGDAATGVVAAHDAVHVVAPGVQTRNGLALGVEHLGVCVATQACESAQAARHHAHGVKRPLLQRGHAGVGASVRGVALDAVVGRFAFAKLGVAAGVGHHVVARHRGLQGVGLNAAPLGQFLQAGTALQIAIGQPLSQRHRGRFDRTQAPAADEAVVAQQPRLHGLARWQSLNQTLHDVVVSVGLVGEALAPARDRDQPGLGALNQMRKVGDAAIGLGHQGHRCQGSRLAQVVGHHRTQAFAQAQTVAGVATRGG